MVSEHAKWENLLRDALVVLSLSPDDQVRANGPGCVVCDILEDYDHARRSAAEAAATAMSQTQQALLDQIDSVIQSMEGLDVECWNEDAIRQPKWRDLRELAARALQHFGWTGEKVAPFVEETPGVWKRPLNRDGQ